MCTALRRDECARRCEPRLLRRFVRTYIRGVRETSRRVPGDVHVETRHSSSHSLSRLEYAFTSHPHTNITWWKRLRTAIMTHTRSRGIRGARLPEIDYK